MSEKLATIMYRGISRWGTSFLELHASASSEALKKGVALTTDVSVALAVAIDMAFQESFPNDEPQETE